jgi:prepilin-type N-terminal cleavage/methylation domain-containing protein
MMCISETAKGEVALLDGQKPCKRSRGFTLIEMSIVLVIIGLVVGGVLVGQDLIRAAYVRAQISQIEKFNTAVNTFYGKYQGLPGDLNASVASTNGFAARGVLAGQGDGNGIIEGSYNGAMADGYCELEGETAAFWVDLTSANGQNLNLIDSSFNLGSTNTSCACYVGLYDNSTGPAHNISNYFPAAKLGQGNYVYVWSQSGFNYYGLSVITDMVGGGQGGIDSVAGMSVSVAYNIDKKIDDGQAQTGRVQAMYITGAALSGHSYSLYSANAGTDNAGTCFNNSSGAYSTNFNGGAGKNCALSFQFQ